MPFLQENSTLGWEEKTTLNPHNQSQGLAALSSNLQADAT